MTDVESRVRAILQDYAAPSADVAWLLCDRHPREQKALTVVDAGRTAVAYSYGDLADRSRLFAGLLTENGIGRGDRVATVMGKSADLVSVILGTWRVGAVYVPLFTAFARGAVESRLMEASAAIVVADEDQVSKVPAGPWRTIVAGGSGRDSLDDALWAVAPHSGPSIAVGGNGPLVHMFTSGTTGTPKGVIHPVGYIAGWLGYLEFALGVQSGSVFWSGADPGWAYGLYTAVVAPLAAGIPTILLRGGFSAEATWAVLSDSKVTDFAAAPTVYRGLRVADVAIPENLALKRLSSAGEPLTPEVNEWASAALGLQVHDHYGQTELGMPIGYAHHPQLIRELAVGSMGPALPGWEMTVLDELDDIRAEPGKMGRLAVVVDDSEFMTFTGYAGASAGTTDRFRAEGKYFVTGDSASIDNDGTIRFSSRDDDVIIMAGYRIGPFDVESALLLHPAVVECAVIAAPDEVRGEVVEAFVVLSSEAVGSDELVAELQAWVKTNYAAHAYPRQIHFADLLPKTPSGKIQRAELRRSRREANVGAR
ncbi:AMP-binding protein [Rhodococcoides kyotonense]|uniref:Acetyl-CoA synthetase n=1 Tax=Rhodococcoides kyotonense TaxID=398843 RepID=A0A239M344_9NOCA|nr:AMP-binding protein [Rhodococcus kyotonensis]SNT37045.1 acetyl-CoA synthetase [Rhodococcus kyotonensis]